MSTASCEPYFFVPLGQLKTKSSRLKHRGGPEKGLIRATEALSPGHNCSACRTSSLDYYGASHEHKIGHARRTFACVLPKGNHATSLTALTRLKAPPCGATTTSINAAATQAGLALRTSYVRLRPSFLSAARIFAYIVLAKFPTAGPPQK